MDTRIFAHAEAMIITNIANETTVTLKCNTKYIQQLDNGLEYALALEAKYSVKFVDACTKGIFQDMMTSQVLAASS